MILPAYGNHDARRKAYQASFVFPQNGELGGVASHNAIYFSMDYQNIHLVYLDTESHNYWRYGDMLAWLEKDLAANQQQWTIVIGHSPPYSKGGHDSDSYYDSRMRMVDFREKFNPILEKYNTDLVLSGHSHFYSRSYLMHGHYGPSSSFDAQSMVLNNSQTYHKNQQNKGTVYMVVGNTTKLDCAEDIKMHPAQPIKLCKEGSVIIEVDKTHLRVKMLSVDNKIEDQFVLIKDQKN